MYIDPHVHCRDEEESYKETIAHALKVAEHVGMTAIIDMPNVPNPVMSRDRVVERLRIAAEVDSPVKYYLHMAPPRKSRDLESAVAAYNEFPEVAGFKLYMCDSTGNLGVKGKHEQLGVVGGLVASDYRGVLVVHAEDHELLREEFNPRMPKMHAYNRPHSAEVAAVRYIIDCAKHSAFQGKLHIAHVSVPQAVEAIHEYRANPEGFTVTSGVCPHHLFYDFGAMDDPVPGLLLKMNPPLRPPGMNLSLRSMLKDGSIDWLETDHAPHALLEKLGQPPTQVHDKWDTYPSGVPNLQAYHRVVTWLQEELDFSDKRIREITFDKANDVYDLNLSPRPCTPNSNPDHKYPYDPYPTLKVCSETSTL